MSFFNRRSRLRIALLCALPFTASHSFASDAAVDSTFGTLGRAVYDLAAAGDNYDRLHSLGALPAGGYLALASRDVNALDQHVFVVQLTGAGTVVGAFDSGIPEIYLDASTITADGRALLARILFLPQDRRGVRVERRLVSGALDASFGGGDGVVDLVDASGSLQATAVSVDGTGRVAVGGYFLPNGSAPGPDYESFAAVLTAEGAPLVSFGGDGIARVDSVPLDAEAVRAVLRDGAGRVLLCGNDNEDAIVTRLRADGEVDTGFGGGGSTLYDTTPAAENWFDSCTAMAISPTSGRLHIAMEHRLGGPLMGRVRVLEIGELGQHAASVPAILQSTSYPGQVQLVFDPAGRALVAATLRNASNETDLHVARLTPALAPDPTFAGTGSRAYPLLPPGGAARRDADSVAALFFDRGRIVLGASYGSSNTDALWAIHRLQGFLVFADGFE